MPSSNLIKNQNLDLNSKATVLEYKPREFNLGTPTQALEYLERKKQGSDFVMSDTLRVTTGVAAIEEESDEQILQEKVLAKVAEIQKQAYEEGFKLGKDEGYKQALENKTQDIESGINDLLQMMDHLHNLKQEVMVNNESHLVQLVLQIAEKIALDHVNQNPESILSVIQHALKAAQAEEDVVLMLSPEQFDFIEKFKANALPEKLEILNKIKIQSSDAVQNGGCIVQTNFGEVDARIKERIEKIWSEIITVAPKTQNIIG